MKKLKKLALATAVSSAFILSGCGGSSGGSSGDSSSSNNDNNDSGDSSTVTGVFVDAPVAGINYTTTPGGISGQTNELGEYNYVPGDTVVFSIGDTELPAVEATGRITPADMGSGTTDWSSDQTVVNILRLLQSLDSDKDPGNGITISENVHTALQDIELDPTVSESAFETQVNSTINIILRDRESAVEHFENSQAGDLIGSWVFEESNGNINVLIFLNDSEYLIAHSMADDGDQRAASAEYGTYSWDSVSGEFSVTLVEQSDSSGGLIDETDPQTWNMQLKDGALVLTSEVDNEEIIFEAVSNAQDSLTGSWYLSEGVNNESGREAHNVLTILDDSHYVVTHNANEEHYDGDSLEAVSSEWGTYSFNGTTFAVTSVSAELDGPGGLFDNPANNDGNGFIDGPAELHPTGQLTLTDNLPVADGGEQFTLRRLGRYAVTLRDLEGDTKQVYVEASGNDFTDGAQTLTFADIDDQESFEVGVYDMDALGDYVISIVLDDDGFGRMEFGFSEDINDIVDDGWSVLDSGSLTYTETSDGMDRAEWTYLRVKGDSDYTTLVYQGHMNLMFITEVSPE